MFLRIHEMRANMVFDDLSHEAGHRAACAGDEVHDLLAPRLVCKGAFDTIDLATNAAHTRQQLLLFPNGMTHSIIMAYLPTLYKIYARMPPDQQGLPPRSC
jgi:hypothetical protein